MAAKTGLVIRAGLTIVLSAVKAQLVSYLPITPGQVLILARRRQEAPHLTGDQDLLLKVGPFFPANPGISDRIDCRVRQRLTVVVRTRWETDEADRDDTWLLDPNVGNRVLVEDVLDALQKFEPADQNGNALVYEPMKFVAGGEPGKDPDQGEWGEDDITFELPLTLPLKQSWQ